ncbi:MAG: T9SS type A sorting domain-containing protein [Ignavibacteriales bacterium]|nr:T9SS type A sorting domain-containing protein [Ignavibacteriales bacterium]
MQKLLFVLFTLAFGFQIAYAQFPTLNPNWTYIRADNTGVGGDQHFVVRGDRFGNMWTGGRMPFWSQGSLVRFDGTTFTNWGTYADNYLPDEIINNIAFDSNDRIWVGTDNGLAASEDGINWQHHTSGNTTLQWDQIKGIAIELNNDVWVVTGEQGSGFDGGVGYYNGTVWTFYTASNSNLPTQQLTDIAIDQNNNKWITCNLGLIKYDGINWILYTSVNSGLSPGAPSEVMIDSLNRVWVCNGPNIDIFDGTAWSHINNTIWPVANFDATTMYIRDGKIILTETTNSSRIMIFDGVSWTWEWTTDFLLSSYIDVNGYFWAAGINAVRKFDGTEWKIYTRHSTALAENSNKDIFVDSKNRKWFANGNGGIQVMDCPNWEVYGILNEGLFPNPQSQSYVGNYISETPDGDIWFTYEGSDGYAIQIPNGDYQNYASWVVWDKNNSHPWFQGPEQVEGNDNGKVFFISDYTQNTFMYDKNTNAWTLWDNSNGITAIPTCLEARSGGKMYVAHFAGIDIYDNGVWSVMDLAAVGITYIYDFKFDASDNMWIGSPEGLWKFDGATWTNWNTTNSNIAADAVWAIEIDKENNIIYAGAHNTLNFPYYGGLSYFNGTGNVFTTFLEGSSPISHKQVEDLALDTLGNIWILTQGEGINVHNPNGVLGFECIDRTLKTDPIPVELISFEATTNGSNISLNWQTSTETNNSGFSIERKQVGNQDWNQIAFVTGFGTTTEPKSYSFTDENLSAGKYQYRLNQIDFDGTFEYSNAIEAEIYSPLEFSLEQNYPNPFNPTTLITFGLQEKSIVNLKVFNLIGEEVALLLNEEKAAGVHTLTFNSESLPSGVYFYKLQAGSFTQTKKMILLR